MANLRHPAIRLTAASAALMAVSSAVFSQQPSVSRPGQFPGNLSPTAPPFGFGPMMAVPQSPELARKTMQIMALRAIHEHRFSQKDLTASVARLKELKDSEKRTQVQAEQALEEERKALLAADEHSPPPAGAGEKMRAAAEQHRRVSQKVWQELNETIGGPKSGLLQALVGQGGLWGPGGPPQINVPGVTAPPGQPPFGRNRPPAAPPGVPGQPGTAPAPDQPGGDTFQGPNGLSDLLPPLPDRNLGVTLPQRKPVLPPGPYNPGNLFENQEPGQRLGPGFGGRGGRDNNFRLRSSPGQFPRDPAQGPVFGSGRGGGRGDFAPMANLPLPQPRIALGELIELLEQKLAAMKR